MKQALLIVSLFALFLPLPGNAETFSCRDKSGRFHVSDNLMNLPTDCRFQAKTHNEKDPSKVNYVPLPKENNLINQKVEQEIQIQQEEIRKQRQDSANLLEQAKMLSQSFQRAVVQRKDALRSKRYRSRKTIVAADHDMQKARKEKILLLKRLRSARMTTDQKDEIEQLLALIKD